MSAEDQPRSPRKKRDEETTRDPSARERSTGEGAAAALERMKDLEKKRRLHSPERGKNPGNDG